MTIIKIAAEWNNSHASLDDVDYILPGWSKVSGDFLAIWEMYKPFVTIDVDDYGEIIGMTGAEEINVEEPELDTQPTTEDILNALLGVAE